MERKAREQQAPAEHARGFSGRAPLLDIQKASARIVMVFCDTHYDAASVLVRDFVSTEFPKVESIRFSDMLAGDVAADMLLINSLSPDTIVGNMGAIDSVLGAFKKGNPDSAIVIVNLYGKGNVHGAFLHELESRSVAKVLEGPVGYMTMIDAALGQMGNGLIKNSEQ